MYMFVVMSPGPAPSPSPNGWVQLPEPVTFPAWNDWVQFPQSQLALVSLGIVTLAAVAGWISAVSAIRSANTAKKNLGVASESLLLNQSTAAAANLNLEPDFTNAIAIGRTYTTNYVFDIEVTNPATRSNTVKKAPLTLILDDGAERSFDPKPLPREVKSKAALQLPLELPAAAHKAGTLNYEVSTNFLRGRLIRRFRIDLTDAAGRKTPLETIQVEVQR
ncbi:hypothetical protein [Paenarthrobacter sp. A20]|uniref:hypothetical protein n=1 Tax=Paenarthrobacter sp. A20 TaxID=2817891 RepID=UPI00209CDB6D|nr:hypothetical protein [Paenarthrobacter sp. A20]MCP1413581.1 hypothetical protein [Paenarthrobacter sp. A20]